MNMPFTPLGTLPHLQPGVVTVPQRDLTPSLAPLTPREQFHIMILILPNLFYCLELREQQKKTNFRSKNGYL